MERMVYLNGEFVEKQNAKVSVFDHGFLYGDGVFEGIRAYEGNVFKLEEHIDRLFVSAKAIKLTIPIKKEEIISAVLDTVRKNNLTDAYIRVVVSRGEGDLGLNPTKCPRPSIIIIADKIVLYPEEFYKKGLSIITASTRRNIPQALSPRIKSLNYLNNIMAKIEANRGGVPEALMLNNQGYVAECTGDNIFILKGKDKLITPPLHAGVLDGITRNSVMGIAADMGIEVAEELFTLFEIYNADECFLTGTAAEVIPVVKIDDREIGSGKVGDITKSLMAEFSRIAKIEGEKI